MSKKNQVDEGIAEAPAQTMELVVVQTAITKMDAVSAGLAELSKRFKGVVFDVTTPNGMAEAKAARKEIAGPRIEVERIRKEAKAPILELGRKLDAEAARIKGELEKLENPIDAQIVAHENRIEAERQALIKAEQDRVEGITRRIEGMRAQVQRGVLARASGDLSELMKQIDAIEINESFAEFKDSAADTKAEVYEQLDKMHAAAMAREQEAERLADERAAFERQRADQAERDRVARENEAKERDRKNAIARRIEWLRGNQSFTAMSSPTLIQQNLDEIRGTVLTSELYDDQLDQAIDVRDATIVRLRDLHATAVEYRAEQDRQAAERVRQLEEQARIDRERAELEDRQKAEREAAQKKAADERKAAEERERLNFKPAPEAIVQVLCTTYQRDEDTVTDWLREYFGPAKKKAAA